MTTIGDIIFAIVWFGALIFGIRLMSNGWSLMTNKEEWEQKEPPDEMKKAVKESTHPEMQDLKAGEQLLSVNFVREEPPDKDRFKLDSPALHGEDPLHKSLQDRINKLRDETDKDDDGDDDGGAPVPAVR